MKTGLALGQPKRVLLAEDDLIALDVTSYALGKCGYDVVGVTDGASAIERWQTDHPDLVLLDIYLPSVNGMDVCRAIRAHSSTPIIMVSVMYDEAHIIEAFESGADHFISKPVRYRELALRMRSLLRRRPRREEVEASTLAWSGELCVNLSNYEVHKSGKLARMTPLEARALYFLVANAGQVVASRRLIELVWNYNGGDALSLKTHISNVRHKLGVVKDQPGYISSVANIGYRLEIP